MLTKEQVVVIGAENLADIFMSLYEDKPDIQKLLEISVASFHPDPEKIVTIIEEELESLKDSCPCPEEDSDCDFDPDCHEQEPDKCGPFAEQLDQVRQYIVKVLLPKFPSEGIKMLLKFLDIHVDILDQASDSGFEAVFQRACANLGKSYEHTNPSLDDVVNLVYDRFMENNYCVYDHIIRHFKGVLKDDGLSSLIQKLEKTENHRNKAETVRQGLKDIADCQSNVDTYIKGCSYSKDPDASEHLAIAERLIEHGRGKEAIQWLDSAVLQSKFDVDRKRTLKFQALNQCNDLEGAQAERINWFFTTLNYQAYKEILENAEADCIESFKKTAIEKALDFPDARVAFHFLNEIKNLEQIGKLVRLKINSLKRDSYRFRPIAKALHEIDPLAATLLYREMIESVFRDQKPKYYHRAAEDLTTCDSLSSKITDWQTFPNHQQYFQEISVAHKRKKCFWPEYDSAVQKQRAKKAKLATDK